MSSLSKTTPNWKAYCQEEGREIEGAGERSGAAVAVKAYKHYRPRYVWFQLIILGVAGLGALAGLAWSASTGFRAEPPFPVFVLMLVVIGANVWFLGRTAIEVRLGEDGHVEFVAPLRSARIPVLDILSIAPSGMSHGLLFVLRHSNGSIRFDPKLNGMHELITELKQQNPDIKLRGI